jgi:hypothetical protein
MSVGSCAVRLAVGAAAGAVTRGLANLGVAFLIAEWARAADEIGSTSVSGTRRRL